MSTNSHHQVNQLDPTYNAYLQRLVFLLSKRIVWNIKGEKFDEQKWEVTFRKLHKNMHIMEKAREVNPKFSDIIKELADNLGIAADENWDLDSLSRLSSVSASRYGRRPSINLNTLRNGSLPLQSKDFDSINGSVDEQKKKWPFAKSGSKENKTMIALEKIVNSSVNYSKINTTRNEDQVLAEIKNSCNLPSTQDDQSSYFSKILKTDGEKPSTRVGTAKSEKPRPKKRANTPQFYYNGAFDIPTDLDSAKKKPKPPRARPSGFISSQENRPKTGYSFRTHDLNLSINKNDDSLLTQEPNVVNHSLNMTVNQTPLSVLDESCEFRALKPPRGRGLDQVVRSFKNQTETYGSGQFKNMTSKRSSFDSQVRGSRTKEPLGGDNPIKVVHNVQTIKMIYGSVFSEETVHEGVSENNAVV